MVQVEQAKGSKEYKCVFCGTTTYFVDEDKAYCIDCYCKLRNSAHTHDVKVNPQPVTITPMSTINPITTTTVYTPPGFPPGTTFIC